MKIGTCQWLSGITGESGGWVRKEAKLQFESEMFPAGFCFVCLVPADGSILGDTGNSGSRAYFEEGDHGRGVRGMLFLAASSFTS